MSLVHDTGQDLRKKKRKEKKKCGNAIFVEEKFGNCNN